MRVLISIFVVSVKRQVEPERGAVTAACQTQRRDSDFDSGDSDCT